MKNIKNETKDVITPDIKDASVLSGSGLGFFERAIKLVKTYSLWDIFRTAIALLIIGAVLFLYLNPTYMFDKYNEMMNKNHAKELNIRFNQTKGINTDLELLMSKLHANRAFFIEYHNSVKSLNGAPFAYGSMDFEKVDDRSTFVADEYYNFSLTKYEMVSFLSESLLFIGTIEELKTIDKKLYLKLSSNNVKEIALIEVEGTETPLGILGVTWDTEGIVKKYRESITKEMRSYSLKMAIRLDGEKTIVEEE